MFTSQLDEHDTTGLEQVDWTKRRKSDKPNNLQTIATKLAKTQITDQAKEANFKSILEEIDNDALMEAKNTDDDADDNEAKHAGIINSNTLEDVDKDDKIVQKNTVGVVEPGEDEDNDIGMDVGEDADEIEEFPDDLPRATHSYKNNFPMQS